MFLSMQRLGYWLGVVAIATAQAPTTVEEAAACNQEKNLGTLDFLLLEDDAVATAVEDDIRRNLQVVGIDVQAVKKNKEDFNTAQQTGDFHLSFTETWGSPYDPHSYASGWLEGSGGEGHFEAFSSFTPPASREELFDMVRGVLKEENRTLRRLKWEDIHNYYHSQAVMLPLWGKRIPTLLNTRLSGFQAGHQQFDYPVQNLVPVTGPNRVTIAPAGQTGLFKTVGRLDPHTYRPNEFFANNWVYEGLVAYGQGGQILPSLATSWTIDDNADGGHTYTFTLRENVQFHDGTPWNCTAAKLNFDHVFAGELKTPGWHGWYGLPGNLQSWNCTDNMTFVVHLASKYAPFLQELTFIRPLRMLSPAAFAQGSDSDPTTHNSCHVGWGTITSENFEEVTCAGITNISGTGPFVFASRSTNTIQGSNGETEEVDDEVVFVRNSQYWGGEPTIETLVVVRYEDSDDVKAALLNGTLDVVWGSGVLPDRDIAAIMDSDEYQDLVRVFHSKDFLNVIMLLNTGKAPLGDINIRKTIIHSIDKGTIVEKELGGLQKVVDNVFPLDAPYCDVELTPRWDYDIEKAILLSCGDDKGGNDGGDDSDDDDLALKLGLGLGIPLAILAGVAIFFFRKSKKYETELELLNKEKGVEA